MKNHLVLYLASASPRRHEILTLMGIDHQVLRVPPPPGDDEPRRPGEAPADYVTRTAREKAVRAVQWIARQHLPVLPILGADTTVILGDRILGKPLDRADAANTLRALSGREHEVRTAVVLLHAGHAYEETCVTRVRFRTLTDGEIEDYCDSGEPLDKAGGYAIQGRAGRFVSHLEGSFTGVMGLPMYETDRLLVHSGLS
ncbi:MAG: septum formation inhibitor Maf [Candidimonas sp.]|nr:MAG: septum formation inhibitor Maf [Candidimonas sp.]